MIKQLEIYGFRGLKKYQINNIGKINLLVGTNNSGKTSILEAIRLLKSKGDPSSIFHVLYRRGEHIQYETGNRRSVEADLCRLFYSYRLIPDASFSITGHDNYGQEDLKITVEEIPKQTTLFNDHPDFLGQYQVNVCWSKGNEQSSKIFPISQNDGLSYDHIRRTSVKLKDADSNNLEFVPTASLSPQKIISLFDDIVLSPDEDLVLKALRIIEPDIDRIASMGSANRRPVLSFGDYVRGGILVKTKKWNKRIPIGSLGDGIWRMLGLILSLIGAKSGTLLIDEVDTGLHHTVMAKMWKFICEIAQELDVQIFATTHSSDCWKSLAENALNNNFNNTEIRIHRINRYKSHPETFTNREMGIALNREIEVR